MGNHVPCGFCLVFLWAFVDSPYLLAGRFMNFFKTTLFGEIVLGLEKSCKDGTKHSLYCTGIIPWSICQDENTNTGALLLTRLQALFRFQEFSHERPFSVPKSHTIFHFYACFASLICNSFSVFSTFDDFAILRSTIRCFCRMSLNLNIHEF